MSWLDGVSDENCKKWLTETSAPLVRVRFDGTIISCNYAFEEEFGWNSHELKNVEQFNTMDGDVFRRLLGEVATGARKEFSFRQQWNCKDAPPVDVIVQVIKGENEFYYTVIPASHGWLLLINHLQRIEKILSERNWFTFLIEGLEELYKFCLMHKAVGALLFLALAYLFGGRELVWLILRN